MAANARARSQPRRSCRLRSSQATARRRRTTSPPSDSLLDTSRDTPARWPAGRRTAPTHGGSAGAGAGRRTDPVCNRSDGRHDLEPRPARGLPRPDAETALPPNGRTVPPLGANSSAPPTQRARPHTLPMGWDDRRTGPDQRHMPMWVGPRPLWSPPAGMSAPGLVPVVPPDLAGLLHQRSGQHPWCEGGHHHSSWPAARDDDAGQTT